MYVGLGCVLDPIPMIVCTVPFIYPVVISLGYDSIWFGVIIVKLIEIAAITPPIGLNLYVVAGAAGEGTNLGDVIRGVVPFLIMDLLTLGLLLIFPEIALFLPSQMVQ
jgi:TRAP-type C4-dicarboxylate transport system permease large subunit